MSEGIERMIACRAPEAPGESEAAQRQAAIGRLSAMVGALILSRAAGDAALSEEMLSATRAWFAGASTLDG